MRTVVFVIFIYIFLSAFVSVSFAADLNNQLNDKIFLIEEGYLVDGKVPIIIRMNVPYDLEITDEYLEAKSNIKTLMALTGKNYEIKRDLQIIGAFSVDIDYSLLDTLLASPYVEYIDLDHKVYGQLQESVPLIDANDTWEYPTIGDSYDGSGVTVAILDTGIACEHESLIGKTLIFKDFINGKNGTENCYDDNGHGTGVAGIVGATGGIEGVAPGVDFNIYKVLDNNGGGIKSNVIAGIQEAISDGSDLLSMSIGYDCYDNINGACNASGDSLHIAVENRTNSLFVIAAGNDGNEGNGTVTIPGTAENAITVGATYKKVMDYFDSGECDEYNVDENNVTCFSSRGPRWDGLNKPDIVAPGVKINTTSHMYTDGYTDIGTTGTSFSVPHVTGVAAILLEKHPTRTPQQIKDKIMNSAVDLGHPQNVQGSGRVNALYAIDDLNPTVSSIVIKNNEEYTRLRNVSIQWSCNDPDNLSNPYTGIREIKLSNDNSTWQTYDVNNDNGSVYFNLTDQDGERIVYFKCIDRGGNPSDIDTDSIILDQVKPETSSTKTPSEPNGNNSWYTTKPVTIDLSCSDETTQCTTQYCTGLSCSDFTNGSSIEIDDENRTHIRYRSFDQANNFDDTKQMDIFIDTVNPEANDDYGYNGTWVTDNQTIQVTASDSSSGINFKKYCRSSSISCTTWTLFNGQYTFNEGYYDEWFNYVAYDKAGLNITKHVKVMIDTNPPETYIESNGEFGSLNEAWYVTSVDITLDCQDIPGSGCNSTYYNITEDYHDNLNYERYDGTITLNDDGVFNISYYSTDIAGNDETTVRNSIINVDQTSPETSSSNTGISNDHGWYSENITVTLECSDSTSGCAQLSYKVNDNNYVDINTSLEGQSIDIELSDGTPNVLQYYSRDSAGNTETEHYKEYYIDTQRPLVDITSPEEGGIYTPHAIVPTGSLIGVRKVTVDEFEVKADISFGISGYKSVRLFVDGIDVGEMSTDDNRTFIKTYNPPLSVNKDYEITVQAENVAGHLKNDTVYTTLSLGTGL